MRRFLCALMLAGATFAYATPLFACAPFLSCDQTYACNGVLVGQQTLVEIPIIVSFGGVSMKIGSCTLFFCIYALSGDSGQQFSVFDQQFSCALD